MQSLRAAALLFVFVVVTLCLIPYQALLLRFDLPARKTFPQSYHRFLCRLFGIRLRVTGKPVQGEGVLMVANHTSWLDILVLSAAARVSFVAKAEVRSWPFFSTLARLQETVFVDRVRRSQTGEARDNIRERLEAGDALVLFPEGTSSDGNQVMSFKSALMGAAEAQVTAGAGGEVRHVPVQPVSVAYVGVHGLPMGREFRPLYAWYGDMELVPHLWEALQTGPIEVVIEFHEPVTVDAVGGRKALAVFSESVIRRAQARALAGLTPADAGAEAKVDPEAADLAEAAA